MSDPPSRAPSCSSFGYGDIDELAHALGFRPGWRFRLGLVGLFIVGVSICNLAQRWLWTSSDYPLLHLGSWGVWFLWQGLLFPHARTRLLKRASRPYAAAFYTNIWPGVCLGLSHMVLPIQLSLATGGSGGWQMGLAGAILLGVGTVTMLVAVRAIGIARVGFLGEFVTLAPAVCRSQVYSVIRHPLFVGGALISLGATAALSSSPSALALALINVGVLPVYGAIEDHRLGRVFGREYTEYARAVGGIIPRWRYLGVLVRTLIERAPRESRDAPERVGLQPTTDHLAGSI